MLGSLFVVLVFLCYENLRTWPFELASYLSFASMINSISYVLYYINDDKDPVDPVKCRAQAFLMIWFENSQFIWAMMIGYAIYESIVLLRDDAEHVNTFKRIGYIAMGFGTPLLYSLVAYFLDYLGPIGNWCWIGEIPETKIYLTNNQDLSRELDQSTGVRIVSAILLGFSLLAISLNWYFIYSTIKSLKDEYTNEKELILVRGYINKIALFPLIQTVCMFPSYVNKFFILFQYEYHWISVVQTLFVSCQGLCYALVYGCNTKTKNAIRDTLRTGFCCKKDRSQSYASESTDDNRSNRMIDEDLKDLENYK